MSVVVDETEETEEVPSPSSGGTGRQRRSGTEIFVRRRLRLGTPGAGRGRVRLKKKGGVGSEGTTADQDLDVGRRAGGWDLDWVRERVKQPVWKDGGRRRESDAVGAAVFDLDRGEEEREVAVAVADLAVD